MVWSVSSTGGAALAVLTAALWAISPLCFASAGRRIGSFPVLLLRTILASVLLLGMLPAYLLLARVPLALPSGSQMMWLAASGLLGMALGDAMYYRALVLIGPRRATQVLVLAPVASVVLAWVAVGEALAPQTLMGIALVLMATSYAVLGGRQQQGEAARAGREPGGVSAAGLGFAAGGAVCVGLGAVAARQAFRAGPPVDAAVATVIRVVSTALMLWIIPLGRGGIGRTLLHLGDRGILLRIGFGTLVGPFAGMLCYVAALKYLEAGPVSTLAAMSPLFILPLIAWRYQARIGAGVVLATVAALGGVALICWR